MIPILERGAAGLSPVVRGQHCGLEGRCLPAGTTEWGPITLALHWACARLWGLRQLHNSPWLDPNMQSRGHGTWVSEHTSADPLNAVRTAGRRD